MAILKVLWIIYQDIQRKADNMKDKRTVQELLNEWGMLEESFKITDKDTFDDLRKQFKFKDTGKPNELRNEMSEFARAFKAYLRKRLPGIKVKYNNNALEVYMELEYRRKEMFLNFRVFSGVNRIDLNWNKNDYEGTIAKWKGGKTKMKEVADKVIKEIQPTIT